MAKKMFVRITANPQKTTSWYHSEEGRFIGAIFEVVYQDKTYIVASDLDREEQRIIRVSDCEIVKLT